MSYNKLIKSLAVVVLFSVSHTTFCSQAAKTAAQIIRMAPRLHATSRVVIGASLVQRRAMRSQTLATICRSACFSYVQSRNFSTGKAVDPYIIDRPDIDAYGLNRPFTEKETAMEASMAKMAKLVESGILEHFNAKNAELDTLEVHHIEYLTSIARARAEAIKLIRRDPPVCNQIIKLKDQVIALSDLNIEQPIGRIAQTYIEREQDRIEKIHNDLCDRLKQFVRMHIVHGDGRVSFLDLKRAEFNEALPHDELQRVMNSLGLGNDYVQAWFKDSNNQVWRIYGQAKKNNRLCLE